MRKNILVFITHKTLTREYMDMCFYHLSVSEDPLLFDHLYIYNTHEEELPNDEILMCCQKYSLKKLCQKISIFPYDKSTPKTLGNDLCVILSHFKTVYSETDAVLILKSEIMISKYFLSDLRGMKEESFILTAPFITAKARVSSNEIKNYTQKERCLSDEITFYMEDEEGSEKNDFSKGKSPMDHNILFISCQGKNDFSCHFLTLNLIHLITLVSQSWGGANFLRLKPFWREPPRSFTVHMFHSIVSENRDKEREGCDYFLEGL